MRIASVFVLALVAASPAVAQQPIPHGSQVVDRVVAVVGDTALLLSDLQTELQRFQASRGPLPETEAEREALARRLLQQRVDDLVLLQAAERSGAVVLDEEVQQQVDQEIARIQEEIGSEQALRSALANEGLSLPQYRETLTRTYRDQALVQRYIRGQLSGAARPSVSDSEVEAFFQAQRASLGRRPANLSLEQVTIQPAPSDSAQTAARAEAEDIVRQLREGGDFETLARRFSDDPGTRERGGDLGWFRTGQMVPRFEEVAFALRPGQTSGVVETPFGFHIIRVDKARGAERSARHILIRPEVTDADRARARVRADSVAAAARGGASMAELARVTDTPADQRVLARVPLDQLPPAYTAAIGDAPQGAVVGPFELEGGTSGSGWVVARLTGRQAEGEVTLADVREQVVGRVQEQKIVEQLLEDLRGSTYVSVQL